MVWVGVNSKKSPYMNLAVTVSPPVNLFTVASANLRPLSVSDAITMRLPARLAIPAG